MEEAIQFIVEMAGSKSATTSVCPTPQSEDRKSMILRSLKELMTHAKQTSRKKVNWLLTTNA